VAGIAPQYEERHFGSAEKRGRLRLIASPTQADESVLIHQDARVYAGLFDGAEHAALRVAPGRGIYVHVARGTLAANRQALAAGDAMMLSDGEELSLNNGAQAEVLVFDLPGE
jgi:redox-sensitive bicupin YhaK (pirin superfamily)